MPKKIKPAELEEIIKNLSSKDRKKIQEQELSVEWLEENIERTNRLMKRDFWVGLPWFLAYSISLWKVGMNNITVTIFVIGVVYFVYTTFTTGTYGNNQRRKKVYEELLKKLK
ncbi:MAG TPA: hypothetical protein ENJ95_15160 [Bacteroidetes bacterium]|nr:hypothetical protein [Bacteroidota bacterium]